MKRKSPIQIIVNLLLLFFSSPQHLIQLVSASETESCQADGDTHKSGAGACADTNFKDSKSDIDDLINWLRDRGGFFHPDLEIRPTSVNGYSSHHGLFVKKNARAAIKKDETLLYLTPETLLWGPQLPNPHIEICNLARMLGEERRLVRENKSDYAPYIQFLENHVFGKSNLPATWSDGGKLLLSRILQDNGSGPILPPAGAADFGHYYLCFDNEIDEDDDSDDSEDDGLLYDQEYREENIAFVISKGWENVLTPIYDLISHSNDPDKINVENTASILAGRGFSVKALRELQPGDQIFHSYDRCRDCLQNANTSPGTPELFRDCGFVESYPQRFYFFQNDLHMEITAISEDDEDEKLHQIDFINGSPPDQDGFVFLKDQQDILLDIKNDIVALQAKKFEETILDAIHDQEISSIVEFLDSLILAVTLGVKAAQQINDARNSSIYQVQEETYTIQSLDQKYHEIYQCDTLERSYFLYETMETMQSAYQLIEYKQDPKSEDICFYLDKVYQQCWSYWPHYHEAMVHKTAKYLSNQPKRVLWIGGGDSGLLNEILKYPSIELVVGLELDQQVTRLAFKHFASRPHYDNPKVQWWYGDASKTLLMLPKDYFGSFDMVLVDLSDTLFSLSVSAELDVIEALSLLLRPGGVFEMNELFFKKVSNVFEYTLHYQYHDVPKICDQAITIASNDLDFLSQGLTAHDFVEDATILVENQSLKTKSQFDYVHDFRHNPNSAYQRLCTKQNQSMNDKNGKTVQDQAPGILMVVEAETLTSDLSSSSTIYAKIIQVLQSAGMHIIEKDKVPVSDTLTIVMREGYLVARLLPRVKYCALDIHLWSSFDKHDLIKQSIVVDALGGNLHNHSTSSYRIVSGGMFGIQTWQQDEDLHGPRASYSCKHDEPATKDSASDVSVFVKALETGLDIAQGRDLVVALLCNVDTAVCSSKQVLENHEKVKQVITLTPCDIVGDEDEIYECSMRKVERILESALPDDDVLISALVIDLDVPEDLADGIHIPIHDDLIDEENLFVMAAIDKRQHVWRRKVVDAFRTNFGLLDPVSRAHILFNTTSSSLELAVTAAGDGNFIKHLTEAVSTMQQSLSGITIEIRNVFGGKWRSDRKKYSDDSEPSQFFREEDFDTSDALIQWRSQEPVATQVVSQFTNIGRDFNVGDIVLLNEGGNTGEASWLEVEIVNIDSNGNYDVSFDWGEIDKGVDRNSISHLGENNLPHLLTKEQVMQSCKIAFSSQGVTELKIFQENDIGGDGMICTGEWKTGHALILWDGRFQVDVNVFTFYSLEESIKFEHEILKALPNLTNKLRDVQPRGYGRVVNFKEDLHHQRKRKPRNFKLFQ